jgi:hypothetical protein
MQELFFLSNGWRIGGKAEQAKEYKRCIFKYASELLEVQKKNEAY